MDNSDIYITPAKTIDDFKAIVDINQRYLHTKIKN